MLPVSQIFSDLEKQAEKAVKELSVDSQVNKTIILHPRVWKDETEAKKAKDDPDYRRKMEIVKKLQENVSRI